MTLDEIRKLSSYIYENVDVWVGAPKIIDNQTLPAVVYNFPKKNGNHPFNIESNDKIFIDANGFSYSYTQYLSSSELFNSDEIRREIPMGYKVISSYEKIVFIRNGQIIKGVEHIPVQAEGERYTIISTSEYLGKNGYSNYPDNKLIDKTDYLKIKQRAILLSRQDKIDIYLVCKNNSNINWH